MEIERGAMKAPVATDWVTVGNISGTGIDVVSSTTLVLALGDLPDLADIPIIEVEFTQVVTGGTGLCNAYVTGTRMHLAEKATAGAEATDLVLGTQDASTTSKLRKIRIKPLILQNRGLSGTDSSVQIIVKAKGSAADTAFAVTGIRARFVYIPL